MRKIDCNGRVKRPTEILSLRKSINNTYKELLEEGFYCEMKNQQYREYEKGDLLITVEYAEMENIYYGIIINDGITLNRSKIECDDELKLFIREMRKVVRYSDY